MQAFMHCHAQLEDDTLWNIQPVKVVVENAAKTAIEFPCDSDDAYVIHGTAGLSVYLVSP